MTYELMIGRQRRRFLSFKHSSAVWAGVRDSRGCGASKAPAVWVCTSAGYKVASISYNGRVWGPEGREIPTTASVGERLDYVEAGKEASGTVLDVDERGVTVHWADRAEPSWILWSDAAWWQHIRRAK